VKKFLLFTSSDGSQFRLPITEEVLEAFCLWAGRNHYSSNNDKISSSSLKKYLIGLKAWHNFHIATFPTTGKARIDLMLKASARLDACTPTKPPKPPVMLWHLMLLMTSLFGKSDFDTAVADLCIVAFWGVARLSELTYDSDHGPLVFNNAVLLSDVTLGSHGDLGEVASITVRGAKTAAPGDAQLVIVSEQQHILCPVRALKRRISNSSTLDTSLFGYDTASGRRHLTRRAVVTRIQGILRDHGETRLLGHSFRVGGASLRHALGMEGKEIQRLGRWTSRCYLLYIRNYSQGDLSRTIRLLKSLVKNWRRML
jgi:hypothetical protein